MSANHQINVNEASREDSKKTMPVVAGNDGKYVLNSIEQI